MTTLQAYYDGNAVQILEKYNFSKNQKLIITVLDESEDKSTNEIKSLRSSLSNYANPLLQSQEKNAWNNAVKKLRKFKSRFC